MRKIKLRYVWRHKNTGKYILNIHTLAEIALKKAQESIIKSDSGFMDYYLIAHDEYTGLQDRTGKEIFEGDVVRYDQDSCDSLNRKNGVIAKVEYKEYGFKPFTDDQWICDHYISLDNIEVLGNIYENPELLNP